MKILVTGGSGFIGRRLVEQLAAAGHEVVALVRGKGQQFPASVQEAVGDLLELSSLQAAAEGCEQIFHLAARVSFDCRERDALLQANGVGTENLLRAGELSGAARIVVVSSACTAGLSNSAGLLLDEESSVAPELIAANPYLESKLACEHAAIAAANRGQQVVIVCPTTVYGPGDYSLNSGTLVLKTASSRVLPVPSGGSNMVDVDDVVRGIRAAAERGKSGQKYLLGGSNLPFAEIFSLVAEVVGRAPLLVPVPRWMRTPMAAAAWLLGQVTPSRLLTPQIIGDLFSFKFYSTAKAARELDWTPAFGPKQTLERAWRFYTENGLNR